MPVPDLFHHSTETRVKSKPLCRPSAFPYALCYRAEIGQRNRRHTIAVDADDDPLDEGVSVTSCGTNDTYPSGDFVFLDGGPKSETSSIAGSGVLENDTQAIEDFREAVDQLGEKR